MSASPPQADSPTVAALILAAGASRRMGQPKQLLDWGGRSLVRVVAEHALAALEHVLVVTGGAEEQVRAALAGLPVLIVTNPSFAEGQSSSLRGGVAALPEGAAAALVLLGDQPFVTPAIIGQIIAAWRGSDAAIVAPSYGGQRGHPVLFSRAVFPELLATSGDQGARAIVRSNPARVQLVPFDDERPLIDIDTPEDYARLVSRPSASAE